MNLRRGFWIGLVIPLVVRYVVQHGHGFKLKDKANFDWVCFVSSNLP
jgi:hypothetical protein